MKTIISIALSLALCGCVSQQSQQALSESQAACAAGNRDACTAAGYQAQAIQQEQQANAAVAAGIGAALLGGALAGAAAYGATPAVYVPPPHWHRF